MSEAEDGARASLRARIAVVCMIVIVAGLMIWNPPELFLWIKAVHVIAVISWMAGLVYLPRLFVYHSDSEPGSEKSETFKVMEDRLFRIIMRPAMVVSWILGLWLAWQGFGFVGWWLWLKIAAVFALTGVHEYFGGALKAFASDRREKTARYWRMINEAPTLLMIFIVIMVIVKPF